MGKGDRGRVVEQALALGEDRKSLGRTDLSEHLRDAHRIGSAQDRAQQQGLGPGQVEADQGRPQAQEPTGEGRRQQQCGNGQREDRTQVLAQIPAIHVECSLEHEGRQEHEERYAGGDIQVGDRHQKPDPGLTQVRERDTDQDERDGKANADALGQRVGRGRDE